VALRQPLCVARLAFGFLHCMLLHSPDGQPIHPPKDQRLGGLTAIATLTAHRSRGRRV